MCGIIGIISKHSMPTYGDDLFTDMLRMDTIRGPDSTGCFGVTRNGKVDYLKGNANGYVFTETSNYYKFRKKIYTSYEMVIGHNRKATKGVVKAQNSHPFKEGNIILVHNGTIYNADTLNKEAEVDSHAIAHALSEHKAAEALEKINGAYALVWYDLKDKTLNLARNRERPLHLLEYGACWIISSELGLPFWLQGRENRKSVSHTEIPLEKIIQFPMGSRDKAPLELEYKEYKTKTWSILPSANQPYVPSHITSYPTVTPPTSTGLVFYGSQTDQRLLVSKIQKMGYKVGDKIFFNPLPYPDLREAKQDARLMGTPVVNGEDIADVTVQAALPKNTSVADMLLLGDQFSAEIINIRPIQGEIIWFVKNVQPVYIVKDVAQREYDINEIIDPLKEGCLRCKGAMRIQEIEGSVVDKKADGGWRLMCKNCVDISIDEASKQAKLKKGAEQPNVH
jgi:hypothetical protein